MRTESLKRLLQLLDVAAQSGTLSLEPISAHTADLWQAQLVLMEGKVKRCIIWRKSDNTILFRGDEIPPLLFDQGDIEWWLDKTAPSLSNQQLRLPDRAGSSPEAPLRSSITPQAPGPAREVRPMAGASVIPRRIYLQWQGIAAQAAWTRDHRQVWLLIDGQKTAQDIATLLHKPYERILALLEDFRSRGLIDILNV